MNVCVYVYMYMCVGVRCHHKVGLWPKVKERTPKLWVARTRYPWVALVLPSTPGHCPRRMSSYQVRLLTQ